MLSVCHDHHRGIFFICDVNTKSVHFLMLVCFGSSGEASYAALMMALTLVVLAFLAFEKGGESMLQAGSSSYLPEKSSLMDAAQASSAPQMTMSLTLSSVLYMQHHLKPV